MDPAGPDQRTWMVLQQQRPHRAPEPRGQRPDHRRLRDFKAYQDHVLEVHVKPGDAVIFNEITIHGTLKWQGKHQRCALLYHYCPRYQSTELLCPDICYPDYVADMTAEQQAMLKPPQE